MKLFVWERPYPIHHGASLVFAVARSLEEAREVAARGKVYLNCQDDVSHEWLDSYALRLGEPTRVVDLPCAEWHEWEEGSLP